jgi:serine phosphatase RsbU (regulator of sigma subunit)
MDKVGDDLFFAAVDCTGHGVPGALVSVVGYNGLNRVLNEFNITEPAAMLDQLNVLVEETFSKSDESIKDGMDIALCKLNLQNMTLQYAGANNALYVVRDNQLLSELETVFEDRIQKNESTKTTLLEIKADKQPIGKYDYRKPFANRKIQLHKNDRIYLFSDGFADQFGGIKGKKFMYKPFKKLLTDIANLNSSQQKERLAQVFHDWKNDLEQIDDVCILGVQV